MYSTFTALYLVATTTAVAAQGFGGSGPAGGSFGPDDGPPDQMGFGGPQGAPPKEILAVQSKVYSYMKSVSAKPEFQSAESVLATAIPESVLEQYGQVLPEDMSTAAWYQSLPADVKSIIASVNSDLNSIAAPAMSAMGGPPPPGGMNNGPPPSVGGGAAPGSAPKGMGPKATAPAAAMPAGSSAVSSVVSSASSAASSASSVSQSAASLSSSAAGKTSSTSGTASTSSAKNATATKNVAILHSPAAGGIVGSVLGVAGVVLGGALLL